MLQLVCLIDSFVMWVNPTDFYSNGSTNIEWIDKTPKINL